MNGHTKGRVIVDGTYVRHVESQTDIADCDMNGIPSSMARANAALIAEAFNVADETGRTPAQLAAERAELVAALEVATDWQGFTQAEWLAARKLLALAKVKK